MNKQNILQIIKDNKQKLASYGISRVGVFGSYSRGDQTLGSDIDLLVEFYQGKKNYRNFIKASELLEDILQNRVDLVTDQSLSQYIGPHIKKEVEYV